jgi:hypothetical protein
MAMGGGVIPEEGNRGPEEVTERPSQAPDENVARYAIESAVKC